MSHGCNDTIFVNSLTIKDGMHSGIVIMIKVYEITMLIIIIIFAFVIILDLSHSEQILK
jgi:hypothetical protein